ncbi:cytochrome P450 [Rhizodiscina lignyota]|uniref:Cytochrome P450 n=1 Tax=Rhizodiscina lignyota TaxID=1504668 RepID=A0A9P4INT8_9PEZI|nr:cytochrome P450 [Rhizodiscina lignyota]
MFLVVLQFLAFAAVPLFITHLLVRYSKLRSVPGPFLAAFTDLWRWRAQQKTLFYGPTLVKLHEQYGKLVRIGPNLVSISDPAAVNVVYGTSPVLAKGPSYKVLVGLSQGKLVHSMMTMNEAQQSAVMKGVGPAFTPNAVLEYEGFVDESEALLLAALRKQKTIDMSKWFQLFAMDVLNRNAFSESPGFLEKGTDIGDMLQTVEKRFSYYNTWGALPDLEFFVHKNPLLRWMGSPINNLASLARSQFQKRKAEKGSQSHKDFLQKYLDGQAKYPTTISDTNVVGLVVSSIGAGADTTSTTLTATLFFLMKNPAAMSRLNEEIEAAVRDGLLSQQPRASEVSKLRYLDAVIKESMRLFPIVASGLDRIIPAGGREIAGTVLPAGTIVACHPESVHRDKDLYGEDADKFRPERWLEGDEERVKKMDRAFLGFGCGKRICPGRYVALLEMKKLIPFLLMNFTMKLEDPDVELEDRVKLNSIKYTLPIMVALDEKTSSKGG